MESVLLQGKYPIYVVEIAKAQSAHQSVEAIAAVLQEKIESNPALAFIALFDHFAHTQRINGTIAPQIKGAIDVVFCFGQALPSAEMLAVRPRVIGIADLGDKFVVSFMEAPNEAATETMKTWVTAL